MKLVIDASVAVAGSAAPHGFARFRRHELIAPSLLVFEAVSVLHEMQWRGELRPEQAVRMRRRVEEAPIERRDPDGLTAEAWRVADELGWAKTYDASYVALAQSLGCKLVTVDARLRRGTERLGFVCGPRDV